MSEEKNNVVELYPHYLEIAEILACENCDSTVFIVTTDFRFFCSNCRKQTIYRVNIAACMMKN